MTKPILVAGATGDIGSRIVGQLLQHDSRIRVLTRPGTGTADRVYGDDDRVEVVTAAYTDADGLRAAVSGVQVVISAVSGVRAVIVDAQRALLAVAVEAGVPRFIPSSS